VLLDLSAVDHHHHVHQQEDLVSHHPSSEGEQDELVLIGEIRRVGHPVLVRKRRSKKKKGQGP
jgi:hypothetical protein